MSWDYKYFYCNCKDGCNTELYMFPDQINESKSLMVGVIAGIDEASIWLDREQVEELIDALVELEESLDDE